MLAHRTAPRRTRLGMTSGITRDLPGGRGARSRATPAAPARPHDPAKPPLPTRADSGGGRLTKKPASEKYPDENSQEEKFPRGDGGGMLESVKNSAATKPPVWLAPSRPCPRCEERPCVPGQRLCRPCRTALQREERARHRARRLELAARTVLALLAEEDQKRVRRVAEEHGRRLSSVLAVLVGLAAQALEREEQEPENCSPGPA